MCLEVEHDGFYGLRDGADFLDDVAAQLDENYHARLLRDVGRHRAITVRRDRDVDVLKNYEK